MAGKVVETRPFFYPIHAMPPQKKHATHRLFYAAEKLSSIGINLPSSVKLTSEQINQVAQLVMDFHRK